VRDVRVHACPSRLRPPPSLSALRCFYSPRSFHLPLLLSASTVFLSLIPHSFFLFPFTPPPLASSRLFRFPPALSLYTDLFSISIAPSVLSNEMNEVFDFPLF